MTTFSIENFGCRATDADATAIRHAMLAKGLSLSADHSSADVVVLNTCTVTAAADSQARDAVRKIHRANPGARIIVTGCYAQRAPEELASIEGVMWVVGNSHQTEIPDLAGTPVAASESAGVGDFIPLARLLRLAQFGDSPMSLAQGPAKILTGDIFARAALPIATAMHSVPGVPGAGDRTRPILKIQDGCNNRCAYCVIPFVRGRSRSLPPDDVVRQVQQLIRAGMKEIVLSGINLGSYGRDLAPKADLSATVRRILDETSLEQLRFSSIEPQDVTKEFITLAASAVRIAPHFHVPLQSGADRILRAMHRWYRAAHYAERIQLIRRMLPGAAIGADVIVGFPGETEEDFRATHEFIERLPFTYLHVFSFSARPGTKAAALGAAVRSQTIRDRARTLRALGQQKAAGFRAALAGCSMRALTLARGGEGWTEALTGNYLKVRIPGPHPANEWHEVRLTADPQEIAGSTPCDGLILENNFRQRQVSAVCNG
jgi:threonylcarbamoyladenosine tRNA methylthiotransferase MtaB